TYLEQAKINFVPNYRSLPLQKITTTVGLNSRLFICIVQFSVGQFVIGGVRLKFWDLGGQEELQSLWDKVGFIFILFVHLPTYLEQAKINFVPNYRSLPLQKITTTVGLNSRLFICIVQFSVGQFVIGGVRLKFWDLGGQEELQSLWDKVGFIFILFVHLPGAFPVGEVNKVLYDSMPFVGQRECTVRGVSALRG
ncbi:ADP-ribosylation factor related protein 1, partial [Paragonimus westermani]